MGSPAALLGVRDFVGSVSALAVHGDHAAVLTNGRVIVHPLSDPSGGEHDDDILLPFNAGIGERPQGRMAPSPVLPSVVVWEGESSRFPYALVAA